MRRFRWLPPVFVVSCLLACSAGEPPAGVVATAAGHEWTVEEAASLLAPDTQLPAREEVVRVMAGLWVDYTLLATAAAEDSTLAQVDVTPLVREQVQGELAEALRSSMLEVDTAISARELQERYRQEGTDSEVRARQILLAWPEDASPAEKDSVRAEARALRQRIVDGGEDFAELARELSDDPATASAGGDMGFVGPGQMVPSLGEAVFALQPGEVGDPVETPYGMHIVRVEARRTPPLERFRARLLSRRYAEADSTLVAGLEEAVEPTFAQGAFQRVRELARDPTAGLSARERERVLVFYEGGGVTLGEVRGYLQAMAPLARAQVAQAPDSTIPNRVLRAVTRRELLVSAAVSRGITVPEEQQRALAQAARNSLVEAADQLGLRVRPDAGQDGGAAVETAVSTLLRGMLSGERREVTPLGVMSGVLRDQYEWRISESGLADVAARVRELRGTDDGG
ncbi:MAG: peptidylprolyl isomerase [Gemmatimonadota bacterium]